jgi:hypothetical protein
VLSQTARIPHGRVGADDSNTNCLGTDADPRGGLQGLDRWLQLNLDGLRRDVGRNGVVIVTFDENHTSDGAGTVAPVFTAIVPGVGGGGHAGLLDAPGCDPMPAAGCTDRTHVYDHSSTARTLIEAVGGSCSRPLRRYSSPESANVIVTSVPGWQSRTSRSTTWALTSSMP